MAVLDHEETLEKCTQHCLSSCRSEARVQDSSDRIVRSDTESRCGLRTRS